MQKIFGKVYFIFHKFGTIKNRINYRTFFYQIIVNILGKSNFVIKFPMI